MNVLLTNHHKQTVRKSLKLHHLRLYKIRSLNKETKNCWRIIFLFKQNNIFRIKSQQRYLSTYMITLCNLLRSSNQLINLPPSSRTRLNANLWTESVYQWALIRDVNEQWRLSGVARRFLHVLWNQIVHVIVLFWHRFHVQYRKSFWQKITRFLIYALHR